MGEAFDIANLVAAFHCQQRLHELESEFLSPEGDRPACRKGLREFWPHARKSFHWCAERIESDFRAAIACDKIAGVAGHLLEQERGRHQLIEWREIAVRGTEQAIGRGNLPESPDFDLVHDLLGHLTYLGYLHYANGNPSRARAVLERALQVGEERDRHFSDATAMLHLAFVSITEGTLDEAEELLRRALTAEDDSERTTMEAAIRTALGVIYGRRNQHEAARSEYDQVITLCEAVNDQSGLCTALVNRAGELLELGLRDLARYDLERADTIAKQLGSLGHIGLLQINLARFHAHERSEVSPALFDLLQSSKAHYASTGDRVQHDRIVASLVQLYQSVLDHDPAETTFSDRKTALWELANLAGERGDTAHAVELTERLLRESEADGGDEDRLEALAGVAHRNVLARNYAAGRDRATEALALLDRIRAEITPDQASKIECNTRSALGQSLRHLGDYEESLHQYRRGLEIAELMLDDDELKNRLRGNIGLTLVELGQFDEALTLLRSVEDDLRASEDYRLTGHALFNVAYALHRQGEHQTARLQADAALALLEMISDPMASEVRRQVADWPA